MKKVLLISFEYPTGKVYCGGVGQIVERSRTCLLNLGYEVYVLISPHFNRKYPVKLLRPDNSLVDYHSLSLFLRDYDWHTFGFIIHHFVNLTGELQRVIAKKRRRTKVIYHFHSILRREKDSGFRTLNRFLHNQEKMIALADKIVCPSAYEYDNFARYFPLFIDKVVVIENTIESYPLDKNRINRLRETHGLKAKDIFSIYVGRLEKIKGAHILLNEVPQVFRKYNNFKLAFVGKSLDDELYGKALRLRKKFPNRFFYKRYVEKKELFQYYYLSDICINSSLSESFSLSTHEASLCNSSLLLNHLPVFDKFKEAAVFFDAKKKGDFSNNLDFLVNNPKLRRKLAKKAYKVGREFLAGSSRMAEDMRGLLCT